MEVLKYCVVVYFSIQVLASRDFGTSHSFKSHHRFLSSAPSLVKPPVLSMPLRFLPCVTLTLFQVIFVQALFDSRAQQQRRSVYNAPAAEDVFTPMSFEPPPATIPARNDHPQLPIGVGQEGPLQTNRFYANFFANAQDNRTWTHLYSVWWPKNNVTQGRGLSISHTEREDFIYGPGDPVESFEDTFFRQSLALSAKELGNGTVLTTDSLTAESVDVNLAPSRSSQPLISFPLVQGMAFVTGICNGASVLIQTQKRFPTSLSSVPSSKAQPQLYMDGA